jgi:hypothetical protein
MLSARVSEIPEASEAAAAVNGPSPVPDVDPVAITLPLVVDLISNLNSWSGHEDKQIRDK